ncbi:MAG TPA: Dam family site-specific DNA-(adenine-N6)-methyltransferase [Candidatus Baltobacteraceae bacterium]|nr:Dam family site-specific DNA-(adenine-N6)-methyltransferase [Candidatus Baltobacteraceae bacterium]
MAVALRPAPLAPPLKWAGGKRWLVPHLLPLWSGHEGCRLVEPFVGGLAVTLGLQPQRALLNDLNPHLIAFYKQLQSGLDLKRTKIETLNDRAVYTNNRERFNELVAQGKEQSEEAAALFYYLNRTGYNGLCRFNAKGVFNVPFGRYKTISYDRDLLQFKTALRDYDFTCSDFETIALDDDDFVYADPPYDVEFTSYFAGGFSWDDQKRLAKWLAQHRGPVVASNQATPRILKLYRSLGFKTQVVPAPRRISCDGNRDDAKEMIAVRNL